jgi:hypothetical protein
MQDVSQVQEFVKAVRLAFDHNLDQALATIEDPRLFRRNH